MDYAALFPKFLPQSWPKRLKNHILWGRTYRDVAEIRKCPPWALLRDLIFKANCSLFSFVLEFANQVPDTEISSTNLNTASVAMNDDATAGGENADLTTEEL